ncbi:MAG: flagellar hook-basal body complex protein [Candidatus Gastranaerophilales bacterium]|nr:flagellar hook-basal body complex protein [Candidatus Gastranaerophilales bacterium]
MLRGIEAAKAGMMSILEYNDNIAHSLANANTTAFKQTKVSFKNIQDSVINAMQGRNGNLDENGQLGTLSQGCAVADYTIDFSQGLIKDTGRNFDFAINGDGFFKMKMADGTYTYTRNGVMQIQKDGTFTDTQGNILMNNNGIVKINIYDNSGEKQKLIDFDKVVIKENGEIYYKEKQYGKIDLYDFDDKTKVMDLGENRFVSMDEVSNPAKLVKKVNIQQGALEMSNANSILTLINSMNAQRAYESMNNVMQANSTTLQKATSTVGKAVG